MLRHHPGDFGLQLDTEGFADLNKVSSVLNERYRQQVTIDTLKDLIDKSYKKRYEIKNDTHIRALYGHSVDLKIQMPMLEAPPDVLYHGTTEKAWKHIKSGGLKKARRQYVHLSDDKVTAKKVGKRRTNQPVVLKINVKEAVQQGIDFYASGDMYLADYIPSKFISKL